MFVGVHHSVHWLIGKYPANGVAIRASRTGCTKGIKGDTTALTLEKDSAVNTLAGSPDVIAQWLIADVAMSTLNGQLTAQCKNAEMFPATVFAPGHRHSP
jgi:hypothetical protein